MEIPDTTIYEAGVGILSLIGVVVGILLKVLIEEVKHLRISLENVEKHLSQAKEEIIKVATVVAACPKCPHPDFDGLLKNKGEDNE